MSENWLIIGDSILYRSYPGKFADETPQHYLAAHHDITAVNISSPGLFMVGWGTKVLPDAVVACDGGPRVIDKLIIALGSNDWATGILGGFNPTQFHQHYSNFLTSLEAHIEVYCITPLTRANETVPNLKGFILQDYRDVVDQLGVEFPAITVLDGPSAVPFDGDHYVDGAHLKPYGNRIYTDFMFENTR